MQALLLDYCFAVAQHQPNMHRTLLQNIAQEGAVTPANQLEGYLEDIHCLLPEQAYRALRTVLPFQTVVELSERDDLRSASWDK